MRSFVICTYPKHNWADQVKEYEVDGECSTHGRGEGNVQGFGGKGRRKETTWNTKASMGSGIRMDFREIGWGCRVDSVGSG
jgi:hypothetical protein